MFTVALPNGSEIAVDANSAESLDWAIRTLSGYTTAMSAKFDYYTRMIATVARLQAMLDKLA